MEPTLIKTIDEVQGHLPVAMTSAFNVISPFLYTAERTFIKLMVGKETFDALESLYEASSADPDKAVLLAQRVIVNLGYLSALAVLSVTISDAGIQINSSADTKTAFQWQVEDIKDSLQELGFSAIEEFLEYLEENAEAFPEYLESEEYKVTQGTLIRTAADFSSFYDINGSRFIYQRIFAIMKRVEAQTMTRLLGSAFYKTLMADDLDGKKEILVEEYLKPGLALLTASKALVERVITLEGGKVAFNFRGSYNNMKESMAASTAQIKETRELLDKDGNDFISSGMEYLNANIGDFEGFVAPVPRRRARFNNDPSKGVYGL